MKTILSIYIALVTLTATLHAEQKPVTAGTAPGKPLLSAAASIKKPAASAVPASAPLTAEMKELFGDSLVNAKGEKVLTDTLGGKIVGVYFSAHWCPPCRAFSPKLVEFYNALVAKKEPFEIVFVSSDRSEDAMLGYMTEVKMPWLAAPWKGEIGNKLATLCGVSGIPMFVVFSPKGEIITKNGRGDVNADPAGAFSTWSAKAAADKK